MSDDVPIHPAQYVSSQDRLMRLVQEKYPGYHPVVAMVDLAKNTEDDSIELGCHKEVARYLVAVDRVAEMKSTVRETKRIVVELFSGQEPRQLTLDADGNVLDAPGLVSTGTVQGVEVRQTLRTSGPASSDDGDDAPRRPSALVGAWGDGTTSTSRFS